MSSDTSLSLPKVLVILAAYNGASWLQEQITSILSQEGVDLALLIADDGSSDGTREIINREWAGNPRVTAVFWDSPSGSAGANFRRLYRTANLDGVDFVALADQDDVWHPQKMATAIKALRETGAHGYSCAVRAFWPDGQEKVLAQCSTVRGADFLFEGAGQGCTFVVTSELFRKVREFCAQNLELSEHFHYHDWLIYLLARIWKAPWYFDQRSWMRYRQHLGNEIGSRGSLAAVRRRFELIKNGWYRKQVAQALEICERVGWTDSAYELTRFFSNEPGLKRRIRMAAFVLRHGRRRASDRAVLFVSALAGWL